MLNFHLFDWRFKLVRLPNLPLVLDLEGLFKLICSFRMLFLVAAHFVFHQSGCALLELGPCRFPFVEKVLLSLHAVSRVAVNIRVGVVFELDHTRRS